jgi:hypothetical protein
MAARRYTQSQVNQIFAKAEASAEDVTNWDAYMLGYVSAALGVNLTRHDDRLSEVLGGKS